MTTDKTHLVFEGPDTLVYWKESGIPTVPLRNTIDGRTLSVPDQKNVLECALEAGIYIPHLCHHPDLPENGSCRMCIVEVEGQEGVVQSCLLKAKDGL